MDEDTITKRRKILFSVRRSIRYHARRRMFFDSLYKWTQILSLISGSATAAIVLSKYGNDVLTISLAAAVAIFSAVNLVFGFAGYARLHNDLVQKFTDLEKRIILETVATIDSINALTADRLDIEAGEPPVLRILDMICHNELCRALGYDETAMAKIGFLQRLCAPFFDLMDYKIQAPKSC